MDSRYIQQLNEDASDQLIDKGMYMTKFLVLLAVAMAFLGQPSQAKAFSISFD